MSDVNAFRLDLETSSRMLLGRIWLDYFRLVDHWGKETVLSDADGIAFIFQGQRLRWIVEALVYP